MPPVFLIRLKQGIEIFSGNRAYLLWRGVSALGYGFGYMRDISWDIGFAPIGRGG